MLFPVVVVVVVAVKVEELRRVLSKLHNQHFIRRVARRLIKGQNATGQTNNNNSSHNNKSTRNKLNVATLPCLPQFTVQAVR